MTKRPFWLLWVLGAGLVGCSVGMQPAVRSAPSGTQTNAGYYQGSRVIPRRETSAPFSDNFSGKKLDPRWIVVNPNPDSKIGLNGHGYLEEIASPKNGGSDLFSVTNYNAPFIVQPINPNLDWTIEVQLNFSPTNNYQGSGILLATLPGKFTDETQFDRIAERAYGPKQGGQAACLDNTPTGDGFPQGVCIPFTPTTTYFLLTKRGNNYSLKVSGDGHSWQSVGTVRHLNAAFSYVGLFTVRQPWDSNFSVYSDALFNYFHIKVK